MTTNVQLGNFFDLPGEVDAPCNRYSVILQKVGDDSDVEILGYVVTPLSIWDWCELHGYSVVKLYQEVTRKARANERTDLF